MRTWAPRAFLIAAASTWLARCAAPEAAPPWPNGPPNDPAFFPVGVWRQDPALAPKYRQIGVNLYVGPRGITSSERLDPIRKAGMRAILMADDSAPLLRDDPAVAGWMQEDEPDSAQLLGPCKGFGPPVPPSDVRREYDRIRAEDPTRPVLLSLGPGAAWDHCPSRGARRGHPEDYLEYARGGDILSFNFYPVNREEPEVAGRLELTALGVDKLRAASGRGKPVWAFVETTPIMDPSRRPAPRDVRAQVWMAIIHGARGIVYFAHRFRPRPTEGGLLEDAAMTQAVARINREIHELAGAINAPPVPGGVEISSSIPIDAVVKRLGGSTCIFAAAMRNAAGRATFRIRGLRGRHPVEAVGEDRSLEAVGGEFSDDFEGYGVRVYRIPAETSWTSGGPEIASSGGPIPEPAPRAEEPAPQGPIASTAAPAPRRPIPPGAHARGADCRSCHAAEYERWAAGRHAAGARTALLNPVHNAAELLSDECLTCHAPLQAATLRIDDFVRPIDRKGPWGLVEANAGKWRGVHCEACHDVTGGSRGLLAFFDPRRRAYVPVKDSTELCQKCHSAAVAGGGSPRGSVHAAISCAGCHPGGLPAPRDPAGSVHHGAACTACHFQEGSKMSLSARGSCARCHPRPGDPHKDVTALDTTYRSRESRNDIHSIRCSTCHPDGVPQKKP